VNFGGGPFLEELVAELAERFEREVTAAIV
jgi:hypothetical protein